MAFNLDHTNSGDLHLQGAHWAFTGNFNFPKPLKSNVATFLTQGFSSIGAIDGLYERLTGLLNSSEAGTSITLSAYSPTEDGSGRALIVGMDNYIDNAVLPDSIKDNVYIVSNSGQLVLSSSAKKGSIGVTTDAYQTYVLTGSFNNINNWVPLINPINCINQVNGYTGVVTIQSSDISGVSISNKTIETSINDIYTGYANLTCLTSEYETCADLNSCLSAFYCKTCEFSGYLQSYATTQCITDCLLNYTNNDGTGALFAPYTLSCNLGTAAYINTGTDANCIAFVTNDGVISASSISTVSSVETFCVASTGELITLNTAHIGDVAVNYTDTKNYILTVDGDSAYSTIENWVEFQQTSGSVITINDKIADNNGEITLDTSNISGNFYGSTVSLTDGIAHVDSCLYNLNNGVTKYKVSGDFSSEISHYATTQVFNDVASTKIVTGHHHEINEVVDFTDCANSIHAFYQGTLINGEKSYSYGVTPENTNTSSGSLMFGHKSKAHNNFEIAQAPGAFFEKGDAQSSSLVRGAYVSTSNWTDIVKVNVDQDSITLINASAVSRDGDAFTLEGAVMRVAGSVGHDTEFAKNIRSTGATPGDVRICYGSDNFALQASGQRYWTANLDLVSLKTPSGLGEYWRATQDNTWDNVGDNWFTTNAFSTNATILPNENSHVQIWGQTGVLVDLDSVNWVQPLSIDASNMTGNGVGVCFTSATNKQFSGIVYGDVQFLGTSSYHN